MRRGDRFEGHIAGVGTTSGVRLVVGRWLRSPLPAGEGGAFADVMVERADGHRILLAPSDEVADYVTSTYTFDEVRVERVEVTVEGDLWRVSTPSSTLSFTVGRRLPLGWALRAVPAPVATSPRWSRIIAPVAERLVPGVRTVGMAREGRVEYYGATDLRSVTTASGVLDGEPLGSLAPIDPPCRFGFSSTPPWPSLTTVTTTVEHRRPSPAASAS
ncbi:hypothetical protein [Nostocoides sp. F2B08]|uniref:hypothetical protein n=1 Tax=Nostocoides sp. F2B08 TaxID=2653936 RepID=UPI00351A8518